MRSRRAVVLPGLALAAATAAAPAAAASATTRPTLRLPAPTGPYRVGAVAFRLVDTARPDPWRADQPFRELMVGVRYPVPPAEAAAFPVAPHMLPGEASGFAALNNLADIPGDAVDWAATPTHAHLGAPVCRTGGPFPVVLHSPGVADPRSMGTTLCDDLASRGHAVVTVDHTYDATAVQFPGEGERGRVEHSVLPGEFANAYPDPERVRALLRKTLDTRVADIRFVLDALPGALPGELRGALDFGRTGMFGHSAGGFAALQTMYEDDRVRAGANLDGVLAYVQEPGEAGHLAPVAANGLDRPFLLLGKDGNSPSTVPSWDSLCATSTGWRRTVTLTGTAHASFTDAEALVPQLARHLDLPRETVTRNIGTTPPGRALAAQRTELAAFFDRALR
ncbi:alpha/beta hydrolase family protein [Streptomyces specialis]|uniref:alpha/beta hydrolase family protein n=1 Tax=Streptomyces specialis TaxID=498367 RepID=UPI00073E1AD4|nr:hydrolase [Streptomyces specialis]